MSQGNGGDDDELTPLRRAIEEIDRKILTLIGERH